MGTHLAAAEAAERLGVGTATLKRWADAGVLPSTRTHGGHRRFLAEDVERLRAAQAGAPAGRAEHKAPAERLLGEILVARDAASVAGLLLQVGTGERAARAEAAWDLGLRRRDEGRLTGLEERLASERLLRAVQLLAEREPVDTTRAPWLLTCAEGEPARVPLALVELRARAAGHPVLWAGGPTPVPSVARALRSLRPAALVVLATRHHRRPESLRAQVGALQGAARVHGVELWLLGDAPWPDGPGRRATRATDVTTDGDVRGPRRTR